MGIWDKVSAGLDKAAKATETAIDDGKQRLAAYKARQAANKKAETLGYAVARARAENRETDPSAMDRLIESVNAADAQATALEAKLGESKVAGDPTADATGDATGGSAGA